MKLTDGKKVVDIKMQVWNGSGYDPDWSQDFFEAGSLATDDSGASVVDDVDYCIEQAQDWAKKRGDYADVAPWEENQERFVFVTEE
jgi:alkanesulfonate monooxygenase SsuD/methylene tetrahydromethanopterin reductase-like flavin-dependent oxidoreductase (luciferase family)